MSARQPMVKADASKQLTPEDRRLIRENIAYARFEDDYAHLAARSRPRDFAATRPAGNDYSGFPSAWWAEAIRGGAAKPASWRWCESCQCDMPQDGGQCLDCSCIPPRARRRLQRETVIPSPAAKLTDRQQEVYELVIRRKITQARAAEILGVKQPAVARMVGRIKQAMGAM